MLWWFTQHRGSKTASGLDVDTLALVEEAGSGQPARILMWPSHEPWILSECCHLCPPPPDIHRDLSSRVLCPRNDVHLDS